MKHYSKIKPTPHKRLAYAILAAVILAGLGLGVYYATRDNNKSVNQTYVGPTDDEKDAGNKQKEEIVASAKVNTPSPQSPTSAKTAQVVIIDANPYNNPDGSRIVEVRALIKNLIESNGTCKVSFTKDTQTVTRQIAASADATTTQCPTIEIPRSEFGETGTWEVSVTYSSPTASGEAKSKVTLD